MASAWTLPLVQQRLDELLPRADFLLPEQDMVRLFGLNSAAVGRINRFAAAHRCTGIFTPAGVVFRKA